MPSRATKTTHVGMAMHDVEVLAVCDLTPRLRRVVLGGPTLTGLGDDGPDQRAKLLLPRPGQREPSVPDRSPSWYATWLAQPATERPVLRTYTIRAIRHARAEVDVDIVRHVPSGPGCEWVAAARPGARISLYGAWAEYETDHAGYELIAADHSGLPAALAIAERLPSHARGRLVLAVDESERMGVRIPAGFGLDWVRPGRLVDAIVDHPADETPDYAWVVGEQSEAAAMRRHLVRIRGLAPEQVMFMGYWRRGGSIEDV